MNEHTHTKSNMLITGSLIFCRQKAMYQLLPRGSIGIVMTR